MAPISIFTPEYTSLYGEGGRGGPEKIYVQSFKFIDRCILDFWCLP